MMPRTDSGFPEPGDQPPNRSDVNPIAGRVDAMNNVNQRPEPGMPPGLNAGPDALSLLSGLRRRWLLAVTLGGLLGCVAAAGTWYLLSPKHTASAQVRVLFSESSLRKEVPNATAFTIFLRSQASLLTSRPVIVKALQRDEVKRLGLEAKYPDVVSHLSEELKVELSESSEFLTLTYSCSDPTQATTVVKAITETYIDYAHSSDRLAKNARFVEMERVYNEARNKLSEKVSVYETNVRKNGNDPLAAQRKAEDLRIVVRELASQLHLLAVEKAKLEGSVRAAQDRLEAARNVVIPEADVEKALEADLVGRRLIYDLTRAEKVVGDYENGGGRLDSPTYLRAKEMVERVKPQLDKRRVALRQEMSKRLVEVAEQDAMLAKKLVDGQMIALNDSVDQTKKEFDLQRSNSSAANQAPNDIENSKHDVDQETHNVDTLRAQLEDVRLQLRAPDRITVYQDADLQKRDTKKQILGTVAAPSGVFLVVCLVLAYGDYRQRRVRSVRDMSAGLGIPVFGTVPEVAHPERHLIGPVTEPEIDAQPVLESIDALRTQLLHSSAQESCRIVLVTSAVAGEGKTTLASHLATSLARAGRKTLLVDGDLRRPALHQLFELPQQPGLSEVLLGEVECADAVQATTLDGLSVVTAGQWDRDVMQALARGSLAGVFEKLRQEFDFVIVDSHPVLAATDSLLIAQQVEGVILSVRRDLSQTPRVYAAQQKLASLGVRLLGAVVSGADPLEAYGASTAPVPAAA